MGERAGKTEVSGQAPPKAQRARNRSGNRTNQLKRRLWRAARVKVPTEGVIFQVTGQRSNTYLGTMPGMLLNLTFKRE